jgi:hypothetical protein
VSENQHRWKEWIEDDRAREILEGVATSLERAWTLDRKSPKNFPINTWWLFVQIEEELKNKPSEGVGIKVRTPLIPEKLSDLIAEPTVKGAYEDHNEGSYEDALKLAAVGYDEGYAAWRKISARSGRGVHDSSLLNRLRPDATSPLFTSETLRNRGFKAFERAVSRRNRGIL